MMFINIYLNQSYGHTLISKAMQRIKYVVNITQNNIYTVQLQNTGNFQNLKHQMRILLTGKGTSVFQIIVTDPSTLEYECPEKGGWMQENDTYGNN
jgi:ATP-dependent 26S proteasome regulatory subunit